MEQKSYKEYPQEWLGFSDIANLTVLGVSDDGLNAICIHMGGDGDYSAYIVDGNAVIGEHYRLVATFTHWINIYDDVTMRHSFKGREINLYRAGGYGLIIQVIN